MKNRIFNLLLSGAMLLTAACAKAERPTVYGVITGLDGREVVLLDQNRKEITRVTGNDDRFEIEADIVTGDGRFYYIWIPALGDLGPSMKIPTTFFFIDKPGVEIVAEIVDGNLRQTDIKGSPMADEYKRLYEVNPARGKLAEASAEYSKAFRIYNIEEGGMTDENLENLKAWSEKLDLYSREHTMAFLQMIPENKTNIVLAAIISAYNSGATADRLQELVNMFDPSIGNSYPLQRMKGRIAEINSSEVGSAAPDFDLVDLDGNRVKLSSFRGKFVLIDFWASWCGPCRKEIPNIKKANELYKDKGLVTIGVSIDTDESRWRTAVEAEDLDYLQLYDPESTTGKLYNYSGIPFIILISPNGTILQRELRGNDLAGKIDSYF